MKPLKKFLDHIHSWPEEARKLAAGILFFIAAIVLFVSWQNSASSNPDENYENPDVLQSQVSLPSAGDNLKEVFNVLNQDQNSQKSESPPSAFEALAGEAASAGKFLNQILKNIRDYVYEPLR